MSLHKSTAYVYAITSRGQSWKPEAISEQFRFIVRLAQACHDRHVEYDLTWQSAGTRMAATITASGRIPAAKPLPKAPKLFLVPDWKPRIFEAEYRLNAWEKESKPQPGFVIDHSSGLSLVLPSSTGEMQDDSSDLRDGWMVTHTASGKGFGLQLKFAAATKALLRAAGFGPWHVPIADLSKESYARRGKLTLQAEFGKGTYARAEAKRALDQMAA